MAQKLQLLQNSTARILIGTSYLNYIILLVLKDTTLAALLLLIPIQSLQNDFNLQVA